MSGPIETTGLLFVAGVAVIAAAFVVPLPKPKPEPTPKPPAYERLAPSPAETEQVSRVAPVIEPPPAPPLETDDHRIKALEQSVYEIQQDQQELKDEIRALVEEIKAK
jgi:hypothetical protein